MIERDMEDLIARYPDDFFPGQGFALKGRQQTFPGVGRFDLFFEDRHGTKILIELKARTAKYEDASQLAKYKDELRTRGETRVLMWLVAPHVPHSVREFLDSIGIEYSEIHVAQFRLVADRRGAVIESERHAHAVREPLSPVAAPLVRTARRSKGGINLLVREFLKPTIHTLYERNQTWITRPTLATKLSEQDFFTAYLDREGIVDFEARQWRIGKLIDWFSADYKSGKYSLRDEFDRTEIDGVWAYKPRVKST